MADPLRGVDRGGDGLIDSGAGVSDESARIAASPAPASMCAGRVLAYRNGRRTLAAIVSTDDGLPSIPKTDEPDWLGLVERGPGQFSLDLTEDLIRLDGQLYGGTGLAASVGAFTAATGRDPLWTTVQFVGTAQLGDTLDIDVEILAKGRSTSQARLTAWHDGEIVLAALGSTGALRDGVIEAEFGAMPAASDPETSPAWDHMVPIDLSAKLGPFKTAEFRTASEGTTAMMWLRMHGMRHQTAETIAYLADFVPAGVVRAAGRVGVGISLDNSVRFGPAPDTEWVLIDVDPYFAHGGFLHGGARIWSQSGVLLAVATQTARARMFD